MPTSVVFPKANLEKTSGEISRWSVSAGAKVSVGDVLFEVEDDKVVVEVDSPADGYIGEMTKVGKEINVGDIVATIYESKETLDAEKPTMALASSPPLEVAGSPVAVANPRPEATQTASGRVTSTPLARRIAKDKGISITELTGSGPNGRVQKRDVLAALAVAPAAVSTITGMSTLLAPSKVSRQVAGTASALNAVWYQKGQGLPVAFIHGFGADYTSWSGLLSGARYNWPALAIDLPCHGASETKLPHDLDGIATAVETTLQAERVTDLVIAAHSFGGAVAARMASRGMLRIRGLCLFAPAGLTPDINPNFISAMMHVRSRESLRPWLTQLVDDPSLISNVFVERSAAARASDETFAALQDFGQTFFPDGTQRFNVLADLASYLGPVRVIHGRQDRILPVEATRALPGNVAIHLWDHCGHMPHFEHRRDALRILEELRRSV